jgi:DNA-binding HxlR family transcriptional regulator
MEDPHTAGGGAIASYLTRQGAVALLCVLSPNGSRFTELADAVDVSRTTLSQRLEEGQEVSLITTVESDDDERTAHEYVLTEAGARLRMVMNQSGLTTTYRLLRDYRRQFDEQSATVCEWAKRNEEELQTVDDALQAVDRLKEFEDVSSELNDDENS